MNTIGIAAGLATFLGIWVGHLVVRRIEFISPTIWLPAGIFTLLGIGMEVLALKVTNAQLSAALGILGITVLWDALEFIRQQLRVKKGHTPANPNNPRHARIMVEFSTATTLNLLKRERVGRPVSQDEAINLIKGQS
jgi:hypothetical protein